jgi:hypothetical protein
VHPYAIFAAVLVWAGSTGGAFFYGQHTGALAEKVTQDRIDKSVNDTREAGQQGAAAAIAKLKPVNRTIVQKAEKEIRENTVYAECRVPTAGVRLANEAITGRTEPASDQQLPGADAAAR